VKGLLRVVLIAAFASMTALSPARADTPEEWIELGTRIHGFFGGFIPVGMRIGFDAKERLHAEPRQISILYYSGAKMPCPCIVDGVMLATQASPGQGTVQIAPEKAPAGLAALIIVTNRKTGEALRYTVAESWIPKMLGWNKLEPQARWDAAMAAQGLFEVSRAAKP